MSCTHDSGWHKEMKPCWVCGAENSDEESEAVSREVTKTFSAEQLAFIRKETEDPWETMSIGGGNIDE